jgi:hypothetical protein
MSTRSNSFMLALSALLTIASAAHAQEREAVVAGTRVELSAGIGVGTRGFERPTPTGVQVLETTPFAAADLTLRLEARRTEALQLGGLLRYRSSLAMTVEAQPLFALTREVPARSSHFEVSVVPALRLGADRRGPRLALPLGISARTFWTETHDASTFGYSLIGPHVRPELWCPFGPFMLRVGPELQWIVAIDRALRRDGVSGQGVSLGAEASVALALHEAFGLELSYRQAHALIAGRGERADFDDTERYVTLRLAGGF